MVNNNKLVAVKIVIVCVVMCSHMVRSNLEYSRCVVCAVR